MNDYRPEKHLRRCIRDDVTDAVTARLQTEERG